MDTKHLDAWKYYLKDQSRELTPFYSQPAGAAKRTSVGQMRHIFKSALDSRSAELNGDSSMC